MISSAEEPIKGWLDNFNGPVGSYIGAGKGIMRVFYMDGSLTADHIPVDVFVKNVIIIAWIRGRKRYKSVHLQSRRSSQLLGSTVSQS